MASDIGEYELTGGVLGLDFANTVGGSRHGIPREYMVNYEDLLRFSEQTGLIDSTQQKSLYQEAQRNESEAQAVYQRAVTLREAVFRIFDALVLGRQPNQDDLDLLNRELSRSMQRLHLSWHEGHYDWEWKISGTGLDTMLGPIAYSAAQLLASSELDRVRECGGDNCSWLFIDRTRNRSRVWCDMKSCGNRAKVRRHRQRSTEIA